MVIAVDGPSGAGKSTVCRAVAERMTLFLMDTGALYRAVTHAAMQARVSPEDGPALGNLAQSLEIDFHVEDDGKVVVMVNGDDVTAAIRKADVTQNVSHVAAHAEVRDALLGQQRSIGSRGRDTIVEGRDIGTVVFPNAELKVYYTATAEARAKRRFDELETRGDDVDYDQVLASIEARDDYDRSRAVAPLRQPDDAIVLDTSSMTFDEACDALQALIVSRQG